MRVLLVHPGPLMYSEIYLRLEPLGLERVAAAVRAAGHEVRLLDLQSFTTRDYLARKELLLRGVEHAVRIGGTELWGQSTIEENFALSSLVREMKPARVVEIGLFRGQTGRGEGDIDCLHRRPFWHHSVDGALALIRFTTG